MDVTTFLQNVEWREYGTEELFLGSIDTSDAIGLPGGFTSRCLRKEMPDYFVSRYTIFKGAYCATEMWRNEMCTFGMEHLAEFQYLPYLFANKFQPDKDFGAIACWHEYIFNRTHLERGILRLDPKKYTSPPHVRFNRERNEAGEAFNPKWFDCNSSERWLAGWVALINLFFVWNLVN
jgi:hypothetical protein